MTAACTSIRTLALSLSLALAVPAAALAGLCDGPSPCVPGKGSGKTDCLIEWLVTPAPPDVGGFPTGTIECTDGDPSCDADGNADGECTFSVAACVNNADTRLPSCDASVFGIASLSIDVAQLKRPGRIKKDGFDALNRRLIAEALRSVDVPSVVKKEGTIAPAPGTSAEQCGAPALVRVPIKAHKGRTSKGRKVIKVVAVAPPPPGKTRGKKDSDRLKLTCLPASGVSVADPTLDGIGPSIVSNATDFPTLIEGADLARGTRAIVAEWNGSRFVDVMTLPTVYNALDVASLVFPENFPVKGTPDRPEKADLQVRLFHPYGSGAESTVSQPLTVVDDVSFRNPNSAAVTPDGARLYIPTQQSDEVWVYDTASENFIDLDARLPGIQGIAVGDNPFHVETLDLGGGSARIWVTNRFSNYISIIDPSTNRVVANVPSLRMNQEIEFDHAGMRAFVSNQNRNDVQVFDLSADPDHPTEITRVTVGMSPRGMAINASDTKLYVANIQSADISVVDIDTSSPGIYTLISTPTGQGIQPRATDDIIGGFADGWEAFIVGARAPRGIAYSAAVDRVFVTSVGPNIGPRPGVIPGAINGTIMHPVVTVIDPSTDSIVHHIAIEGTDPEGVVVDDVNRLLYVAAQGSGQVSVLDLNLAAGSPSQAAASEVAVIDLPLPVGTPTLSPPVSKTGNYGEKRCSGGPNTRQPCVTAADCPGSPLGLLACRRNNPVGLHNGPRGIVADPAGGRGWVIGQFTNSVITLDASLPPTFVANVSVFDQGAFSERRRRLGQIDFFTDLRNSNVSCATCHIDDGQDGLIHEADVVGPRLRRVLSVRNTRDVPPLLQDQLIPDLRAFADLVVHLERDIPDSQACIPCTNIGCLFDSCSLTSNLDMDANTVYLEDVAFFPNPNLELDGGLSATVSLPDGGTGDALAGKVVFDSLNCANCHPGPLYTIDQFQQTQINPGDLIRGIRMRDVGTPVHQSVRDMCQDETRPVPKQGAFCVGGSNAGLSCTDHAQCPGGACEGVCVGGTNDGSPCFTDAECPGGTPTNPAKCGQAGFGVPILRGIWDSFPLLMSGAAGLSISPGPEPAVTCTGGSNAGNPCTDDADCPGGSCVCTDLASPANPGGVPVPERHEVFSERNAIRSVLTTNNPAGLHGDTSSLTPQQLDDLIAFLLSL